MRLEQHGGEWLVVEDDGLVIIKSGSLRTIHEDLLDSVFQTRDDIEEIEEDLRVLRNDQAEFEKILAVVEQELEDQNLKLLEE